MMAITFEFLILMCFHECEVPHCNLQDKMNWWIGGFLVLVVHIVSTNGIESDPGDEPGPTAKLVKTMQESWYNCHSCYSSFQGCWPVCELLIFTTRHLNAFIYIQQKRDKEATGTFTFTNGRFSYIGIFGGKQRIPSRVYCYLTLQGGNSIG